MVSGSGFRIEFGLRVELGFRFQGPELLKPEKVA